MPTPSRNWSVRLAVEPLEARLTPSFVPAPTTGPTVLSFYLQDTYVPPLEEPATSEYPSGSWLTVTVARDGGADDAVSVTVTPTGGTATPEVDFVSGSYTVTFAPGQRLASVVIPVLDDALVEAPESVVLTLSDPTGGATLGFATVTGQILDDDAPLVASSTAAGGGTVVRLSSADQLLRVPDGLPREFVPFAGFAGPVSVALGDVNGDGVRDVIAGASANGHVKVLDGRTGAEVRSFRPYLGFSGAVRVAAGDLNGDGIADVITAAGAGAHVKAFDGRTGAELHSFRAYAGYTGAVNVAAADVTGDGAADIVTGAGGNGHVKVFDGRTGAEVRSFRAYDGYAGAVYVAAGDVDGDGIADVITGATGTGHLRVFDGRTGEPGASLLVPSGAGVAVADGDHDGRADIVAGEAGRYAVYSGLTGRRHFDPSDPEGRDFIYVG